MKFRGLFFLFAFSLFCFFSLKATHNRAGEIIYTRIGPTVTVVGGVSLPVYTYSITIIVYTDHGPNIADRCADTVYFGDGQRGLAYRINGGTTLQYCNCQNAVQCGSVIISNGTYVVKKNIYTVVHTYPGAGSFLIQMFDPNRNQGVHNIPNSDQQPFYLESLLVINNISGANSSPKFNCDPIDRACLGKCFYHDPCAFDVDGDSLSYEITTSRGQGGTTVPGYTYPETGGGIYAIDAVTGKLTWCTPQVKAEYNLAFIVREWRKNPKGVYVNIGSVLRDMQVVVDICPFNNPPSVVVPKDTCVEAGTFVTKKLWIYDPENQTVTVSGNGGAFFPVQNAPVASLSPLVGVAVYSTTFNWQTSCAHIRQQPYQSVIKVEDNGSPVHLVNFSTYNIRVVPPTVKNVTATPFGSSIKVSWSISNCTSNANPLMVYKIYRRDSCGTVPFTPCQTGPPQNAGFAFIGQTSATVSIFTDNNGGNGLVVGKSYSYLVVAVYQDGTQTFASATVCVKLKRDIPVIVKADVLSTSATTGSIAVKWERPVVSVNSLDTAIFTGPYQFNLKHRAGATGSFSTIYNSSSPYFLGLATSFTDTSLNTVTGRYDYLVEFISGTITVGSSPLASSVFLKVIGADRKMSLSWDAETPWTNYKYRVWRKNPAASSFVLMDSTDQTTFVDVDSVVNRYNYCYKITSLGDYSDPGIVKPIINNSQEACATAVDSTAPCSPSLTIEANCPGGFIKVSWNDITKIPCGDDVVTYVLFYKSTIDDAYTKIYEGQSRSYTYDGLDRIWGCYAIQATDSSGNLSALSPDFCIENCPEFELPNVVSANNDGVNDFFKAIKVRQIKEIDLKIFDRWGNLVYTTTDPYFQWNTVSQFSNLAVSEGTFFYICDVYEPRLKGIVKRSLKGWMEVVR